ncbi:MAG: D-sedoheptulose-7-phosphate isomerase [Candidatus Woesearchaeota archaeon]
MNKVQEIFSKSKNASEYSEKYCEYLSHLLTSMNHTKVAEIVDIFIEAEKNDRTIYFLGNGGSAATSTHFACDLGKGTKTMVNRFKTQGLADNFATFTAYANDDGYEHVFSKQLENVLKKGDVVVVITASGNSQNLINAVQYAKTCRAKTVGLLGFDGGKIKDMCDTSLIIYTPKGEYGPVEDIHMVLDHIITTYIFMKLGSMNGS